MNVFKCEAKLDKPLHDDGLCEVLVFLTHLFNMISKVAHYTRVKIG